MARRRFIPQLIYKEITPFANLASTSGFFTYGEFFTYKKHELLNQIMTAVSLNESPNENSVQHNDLTTTAEQEYDNTYEFLANIIDIKSKYAQTGEMINMIAHHWRQPLNAISASSIRLMMLSEMKRLTPEDAKNIAKFIEHMTQKMSQTINDFMNFNKPSNTKESVDFHMVLDTVFTIIGTQLKNLNIFLDIKIESNLKVLTYKKELEHILLNLITNAKDALLELDDVNKNNGVEFTIILEDIHE